MTDDNDECAHDFGCHTVTEALDICRSCGILTPESQRTLADIGLFGAGWGQYLSEPPEKRGVSASLVAEVDRIKASAAREQFSFEGGRRTAKTYAADMFIKMEALRHDLRHLADSWMESVKEREANPYAFQSNDLNRAAFELIALLDRHRPDSNEGAE